MPILSDEEKTSIVEQNLDQLAAQIQTELGLSPEDTDLAISHALQFKHILASVINIISRDHREWHKLDIAIAMSFLALAKSQLETCSEDHDATL